MTSTTEQFDISDNGFLPQSPPLRHLPPYFEEWDKIAYNLPTLNKELKIREIVDAMPLLDEKKLNGRKEYQRAYLVLSMISHSYVWAKYDEVAQVLPRNIAIPWNNVALMLGINPVLTHACVDLYNWHLIDKKKPIELDNLRCIHTFTGDDSEHGFYLVMTAIEKEASPMLHSIIRMKDLTSVKEIASEFNKISLAMDKIIAVLNRMTDVCQPEIFYHVLRPFLQGSQNNDALPNGLMYDGVSNTPMTLTGGSAAESSVFSILDAFFSVKHNDEYFNEIQNYMPREHREFIGYVKENINAKQIIGNNEMLIGKYNECLNKIKQFRQIHFGIVGKYILKMMPKTKEVDGVKGTGGTNLSSFLSQSIKETRQTIIKHEIEETSSAL